MSASAVHGGHSKYQTTRDWFWLSDWNNQRLTELWSSAKAFCYYISFSVVTGAYGQSFCGIFSVAAVYFRQWITKIMLRSLGKYFFDNCSEGWVLHRSLLHLFLEHGHFQNIDISQGSAATCLRFLLGCVTTISLQIYQRTRWCICNEGVIKYPRILEIDQHLAKLLTLY